MLCYESWPSNSGSKNNLEIIPLKSLFRKKMNKKFVAKSLNDVNAKCQKTRAIKIEAQTNGGTLVRVERVHMKLMKLGSIAWNTGSHFFEFHE